MLCCDGIAGMATTKIRPADGPNYVKTPAGFNVLANS
jgi:hypothetical protein